MAARRVKVGATPGLVTGLDDASKKWTEESQILLPVDKKKSDADWPIFALRDVTVWNRDTTAYEDLLVVQNKGPFIVCGRLVVDHDDGKQSEALIKRNTREVDVQVMAFRMSIGYSEGPELWAASDYGFFLIAQSSAEYRPVFNKMCEAILLYYTIMFIYEEEIEKAKKRKPFKLAVDDLLLKYAVAAGDGVTHEEALERCHEHTQFLVSHCPKEEQFEWDGTDFYNWIVQLSKKHRSPRVYPVKAPPAVSSAPRMTQTQTQTQAVTLPRRGRSSPSTHENHEVGPDMVLKPKGSAQISPSARIGSTSFSSATPQMASNGYGHSQASPMASPAAGYEAFVAPRTPSEVAQLLYDTVVDVGQQQYSSLSRATLAGVSNRLYLACRFNPYQGARETLEYFAREMMDHMEKDAERAAAWKASKIYIELARHVQRGRSTLQHITPEKMARSLERRKKTTAVAHRKQAQDSGTMVGPKDSSTMDFDMDVDASDSSRVENTRRGRPSGKVAGLRLASSSSKKRPGSDLDAASNAKGTKALKRSHPWGNGGEESGANGDEESDGTDDIASDGEPNQDIVRLVIRREALPSRKADSNGTWICEEQDCQHVIHNADEAEGQVAVRDHIYSHQDQSEAINLARVEGRGTHRPYSHLLEKLMSIGEKRLAKKRQEEEANGGVGRPKPIKRAPV